MSTTEMNLNGMAIERGFNDADDAISARSGSMPKGGYTSEQRNDAYRALKAGSIEGRYGEKTSRFVVEIQPVRGEADLTEHTVDAVDHNDAVRVACVDRFGAWADPTTKFGVWAEDVRRNGDGTRSGIYALTREAQGSSASSIERRVRAYIESVPEITKITITPAVVEDVDGNKHDGAIIEAGDLRIEALPPHPGGPDVWLGSEWHKIPREALSLVYDVMNDTREGVIERDEEGGW